MHTVKKLPADVLKFFKEQGAKGGRIGGKRSLETMTAEQRVARARKASKAAAAARKAKANKAKGTSRKRAASGTNPVERTDETGRRLSLAVHDL